MTKKYCYYEVERDGQDGQKIFRCEIWKGDQKQGVGWGETIHEARAAAEIDAGYVKK